MALNHAKNSMLYEHGEPAKPSTSSNIVAIIEMDTAPVFNGLPLAFNEDLPEAVLQLIPPEVYNFTIMNLNRVLQQSIPCVGLIGCYALMLPFTCGLTGIPLMNSGARAIAAIEQFLHEQNTQVYTKYNVKWELHTFSKRGEQTGSFIEISHGTASSNDAGAGSSSQDSLQLSAEAQQEILMANQHMEHSQVGNNTASPNHSDRVKLMQSK